MGWFNDNIGKIGGAAFGLGSGVGVLAGLWGGDQVDQVRAQNAARAGFDPYSGMPYYPQYQGMNEFEIRDAFGRDNLNRAPLNQYTRESLRTGPSRNALLAMEGNREATALGATNARKLAAGTTAEARSQLAMKGGLSGGAAERLAKTGRDNAANMTQQANAAGNLGRINIGMEDEKNRIDMLGKAPGMNLAAAQYDQTNLNNKYNLLSGENTKLNAFNLGRYDTQMKTWASGKQAEATQNAGKK